MKTDKYQSNLLKILNEFKIIDEKRAYRGDLGIKSIVNEIKPLIQDVIEKLNILNNHVGGVEDHYAVELIDAANTILSNIKEYSNLNDDDFIRNRTNLLSNLTAIHKTFTGKWIYVSSQIIDELGLLNEKDDIAQATQEITKKIEETKKIINSITEEAVKEVNKQAGEIKKSAQKTARNISVKAAQDQFTEATNHLRNQIILWSTISILVIAGFIILAVNFYKETLITPDLVTQIETYKEHFIDIYRWNSIYHTIIRVTILAVVAAVATFSLKILRANMHMYQHNLHRKRVANSIEAFVNAAMSDEQSDLILTHLVEAVVQFGNSGLIQKEDDNIHASKMTIDNITRYFTTSGKTS